MIISYAYTSGAVVCGEKCRTRRAWDRKYAASFRKDQYLDGWDKSPRIHGQSICAVKILRPPHVESTRFLTMDDWYAEGFAWMAKHNQLVSGKRPDIFFRDWKENPVTLWVIDFVLVSLTKAGEKLKMELTNDNSLQMCAWCGKKKGEMPSIEGKILISHGLCPACYGREMEEAHGHRLDQHPAS